MKVERMIHCWILGDKYDIKEFQDIAMIHLLKLTDSEYITVNLAKLAFENSAPSSPLRTLMAEELACLIVDSESGEYGGDEDYEHKHLQVFDGIPGFASELLYAIDKRRFQGIGARLCEDGPWEDFMVEKGPKKRFWVTDAQSWGEISQ